MKPDARMAAFGKQEDDAGDPPAGVTEDRREPGVHSGARRLIHGSTFLKAMVPSNLGIDAMRAGDVSTCANSIPCFGRVSRHSTTSVFPSCRVPMISIA